MVEESSPLSFCQCHKCRKYSLFAKLVSISIHCRNPYFPLYQCHLNDTAMVFQTLSVSRSTSFLTRTFKSRGKQLPTKAFSIAGFIALET